MNTILLLGSYWAAVLFPPETLRRQIALSSAKGFFGVVTPLVAMPSSFDGWMHVFQAFAALGVATATFVSICFDCLRKRREAEAAEERLDRNREQAMDYFRFRRAKKSKHQRRLEK